jgi:hypothetical protein
MLESLIADAQRREKTITIYSDDPEMSVLDRLAGHGVAVRHRRLPDGQAAFVTIHDGEEYLGALKLADFEELLSPPVVRPGSRDDLSRAYRALYDILENTVFTSLDRHQLLGASREIEDRAFRVGHGTLRVSFQTFSAFETQTDVYYYLATNTALDIHVYGMGDWEPPAIDGVTFHESTADTVGRFWALGFDGGGDEMQTCGLVAQETDGEFIGFWTYDPETVEKILSALEAVE